ncbi:ATP-dependent DNA helicase [Candidatus Micrarchaeota archaeon]|nr:ATP-dependent DNA helicase [Candidatus Micrarchaeota archaeon]
MQDIYFRHDRVRPHQNELMRDMYGSLCDGNIFMAQASTGTGKTDAALSAAITKALEDKLTVFFLTPKISQHKIALDVVNGIAKKHSLPIRAVDMIGRSHCCIDDSLKELDGESFQTSCAKKRKNKHCIYYSNARGDDRIGELKANARFRVVLEGYGVAKNHNDLISLGRQDQCCPYEWLLKLGEASNVIIADYYHLMIPTIRDGFLQKVKKKLDNSIIIIDEAHNLASRVRSSLSSGVNSFTFRRVMKEIRFLGLDSGPIEEEFSQWANRLLENDKLRERVLSIDAFDDFISTFGLSVDDVIDMLEKSGTQFIEKTSKKSACLKLANFMQSWEDVEHDSVRVLRKRGEFYFLSKKFLDPSPATKTLNQCHSAILMSGTLLPMEMHRDILGLDKERTIMKSYPSPFDGANIVNIISDNLTTRYSRRVEEEYSAIAENIDRIIGKTPGGVALFFPSYNVTNSVPPLMKSRQLLVQRSSMKTHEVRTLITDFKNGGVLCGVQGGSLSEGVDYNEGEIKTIIIVGVALEEMNVENKALIDYYERKFGRGWDYGYIYPGTVKALQAAGRGRRKETDRVAVVYLDERFKWDKYNWILNKKEKRVITEHPEEEVERFWQNK